MSTIRRYDYGINYNLKQITILFDISAKIIVCDNNI